MFISFNANINIGYNSFGVYGPGITNQAERIRNVFTEDMQNLRTLTPEEVMQGFAYLNTASQSLNSLMMRRYFPLLRFFPNSEVDRATMPRVRDNNDAAEIKREYKTLNNKMTRFRNIAQKLFKRLGEGTHTLTGDVKVTISTSKDKEGRKKINVVIEEPILKPQKRKDEPGITFTPNELDRKKTSISYFEDSKDIDVSEYLFSSNSKFRGAETKYSRKGNECSISNSDKETRYNINSDGNIEKTVQKKNSDERIRTVVNKDGSTDDYELMYTDDNGRDIETHEHKPSKTDFLDKLIRSRIAAILRELIELMPRITLKDEDIASGKPVGIEKPDRAVESEKPEKPGGLPEHLEYLNNLHI